MLINDVISKKQLFLGILICAVGAFFYCYEFVLRIIPGALQTELSIAFGHISATTFGQLSAFYYFAYSPMQLPVGILMDRYGPRKLLTFACACCAAGSWMFNDTSSLWTAAIGRFLVGFGSSFSFVGVLSLAIHWLPQRYFSLVAGLITTLGMLGLIYGEIKITQMAAEVGWHDVLSLSVFIGIFLTLIILLTVRDSPSKKNLSGNVSVPLLPLPHFFYDVWDVLCFGQVWLIGVVGACLYTSLSVFGELWGKTYLELAHHLSPLEAAHSISFMFLGWAVGAPITGLFSDKSGRRVLTLVIGAAVSLICISLILYYPTLSKSELNALLFVYGVFSATEITVFIMAKEATGATLSGTVFAVTNLLVTLGGVIFQPLVGELLDHVSRPEGEGSARVYAVSDYQFALSILPLSLLAVIILSLFLQRKLNLKKA